MHAKRISYAWVVTNVWLFMSTIVLLMTTQTVNEYVLHVVRTPLK
jgi:hypothetical protein